MAQLKVISKTKFNRKQVNKFNLRYLLTHSFFMYLITALGIYSLLSLILSETVNKEGTSYIISWSIAIIGVLFVPLYLLFSVVRATNKEEKEKKDVIETFEFTKEKIVKTESNVTEKLVLNWNMIAKIVETNEVFYFHTVNDAAFFISKDTFVEGNIDALRTIINKCLTPKKNGKLPYTVRSKDYKKIYKEQNKKR